MLFNNVFGRIRVSSNIILVRQTTIQAFAVLFSESKVIGKLHAAMFLFPVPNIFTPFQLQRELLYDVKTSINRLYKIDFGSIDDGNYHGIFTLYKPMGSLINDDGEAEDDA